MFTLKYGSISLLLSNIFHLLYSGLVEGMLVPALFYFSVSSKNDVIVTAVC